MQMHVGSTGLPEYMFSTRGQWCMKIGTGEKPVEVRKRAPKAPFRGYIYCTKSLVDGFYVGNSIHGIGLLTPGQEDMWPENAVMWNGKVIGEFICDKVIDYWPGYTGNEGDSCLTYEQECDYLGDNGHGYGIHISELKIYDEPLTLDNFRKPCIMPEMPYCPMCPVGGEYISEDEAEAYRIDGCCYTEWVCRNWLKKAPQSWCRVERIH